MLFAFFPLLQCILRYVKHWLIFAVCGRLNNVFSPNFWLPWQVVSRHVFNQEGLIFDKIGDQLEALRATLNHLPSESLSYSDKTVPKWATENVFANF